MKYTDVEGVERDLFTFHSGYIPIDFPCFIFSNV